MNPAESLILPPLSAVYSLGVRLRLAAYRRGLFSVTKIPAPVISVGNITAGGTGKTPLVEWVCRTIAKQNTMHAKKICVLTRGYRRANPEMQVLVSDTEKVIASQPEAGDEPFQLAESLLGIASVICNRNRVAAAHWAIENLQTEVFVLDDGFQHLRLARDLNIVAIDATNPWGGGSSLLHGRLREPLSGLNRADCIVLTRTNQAAALNRTAALAKQFAGDKPIFQSRMVTSGLRTLGGEPVDRSALRLQRIAAFCGVGNPASFFNQLTNEGYQPTFTRTFPDHHAYNQSELDGLVEDARREGVTSLVTTAKDATKLSSLKLDLPCYVLEIRIEIQEEEKLASMIQGAIQGPGQ